MVLWRGEQPQEFCKIWLIVVFSMSLLLFFFSDYLFFGGVQQQERDGMAGQAGPTSASF